MPAVRWSEVPDDHDYPAAADYLALIASPEQVGQIVAALEQAPIVHKKAKDLLRASQLALLPKDNVHVRRDLKKIKNGKRLSPILAVRGELSTGVAMQIADGYHRVCASYYTDENTDIPVRIVPASN